MTDKNSDIVVQYTYNKSRLNRWLVDVGYADRGYPGVSVPISRTRDQEILQYTGTYSNSRTGVEFNFSLTQLSDGEIIDFKVKNKGDSEFHDVDKTGEMAGNVIDQIREREKIAPLVYPRADINAPESTPTGRKGGLVGIIKGLLGPR